MHAFPGMIFLSSQCQVMVENPIFDLHAMSSLKVIISLVGLETGDYQE